MKPKCDLCREKLEEPFYLWIADKRGTGGKLTHYSYGIRYFDTHLRVEKSLKKISLESRKRLGMVDYNPLEEALVLLDLAREMVFDKNEGTSTLP